MLKLVYYVSIFSYHSLESHMFFTVCKTLNNMYFFSKNTSVYRRYFYRPITYLLSGLGRL